jgi:hypothetical protein
MQSRRKHPLPFLVTLAGCVMMLAWVDPANATEVSRQLAQKGFEISQLRKADVAIVKNSNNDLRVFFKGFYSTNVAEYAEPHLRIQNIATDYHVVFPHHVKSLLQADILTWRKRE